MSIQKYVIRGAKCSQQRCGAKYDGYCIDKNKSSILDATLDKKISSIALYYTDIIDK
ncbi:MULTISPECIES: hypothetical protein [Providencia]|uniref:hypothetical protein n=1 Tax=Providencia TaxID=586 RepID=UPI00197E87E9|nr:MULTISPECIES: hypothetical protein [Providencia]MBN4874655.1 hypothetical protein [Providencia stuartii]MBN4879132.1 hypothetical protein [Providencia stuartii]